jgi:hypothetical protein
MKKPRFGHAVITLHHDKHVAFVFGGANYVQHKKIEKDEQPREAPWRAHLTAEEKQAEADRKQKEQEERLKRREEMTDSERKRDEELEEKEKEKERNADNSYGELWNHGEYFYYNPGEADENEEDGWKKDSYGQAMSPHWEWGRLPWLPWGIYNCTATRVGYLIYVASTSKWLTCYDPVEVRVRHIHLMPRRNEEFHKDKQDLYLFCTAHKLFTSSDNTKLLIQEKNRIVMSTPELVMKEADADEKPKIDYIIPHFERDDREEVGDNPHCTLFGPPVYYDNCVWFLSYIRSKSLYRCNLDELIVHQVKDVFPY